MPTEVLSMPSCLSMPNCLLRMKYFDLLNGKHCHKLVLSSRDVLMSR